MINRSMGALILMCMMAACATVEERSGGMVVCQFVDLETTPLRDYWTEEDFQYLLQNRERVFALMAVNNMPPERPYDNSYYGDQDFALMYQRRATQKDMHQGQVHPRDLPITGFAYASLMSYARNYVNAGRYVLPEDWRERFPDIAALHQGHVPNNEDYPIIACGDR